MELPGFETLCSVTLPSLRVCVSQGAAHEIVFLLKSTVASKMDQTSGLSTSLPCTSSCTPLFSAVISFASHFTVNMREKSHYF